MEGNMQGANQGNDISKAIYPLAKSKGWMKFLGVMGMIFPALGIVVSLGMMMVNPIVGIMTLAINGFSIWISFLLFSAGKKFDEALTLGSATAAEEGNRKLGTWFMVLGILLIVTIVIWALMFLFMGSMMTQMMMGGMR